VKGTVLLAVVIEIEVFYQNQKGVINGKIDRLVINVTLKKALSETEIKPFPI